MNRHALWRAMQRCAGFCFSAALGGMVCLTIQTSGAAAQWDVGPGKQFSRIEDAVARAGDGDTILVYPNQNNRPYEKTAVFVRQKRLTIRGVPSPEHPRVAIDGKGFDYSGRGSIPRAIFQFNAGTDDCVLENFELFGASNQSNNGAAVRINQANRITIRNCSIHNNDMGVMSNGDGSLDRGRDQLIERCEIYNNGTTNEPGRNHNLYLGGTSVVVRFCNIYRSLTGHNFKSRAHYNRVEYCYIHDSANREFDLVDGQETTYPNSHTVLLGNVIVKDPRCTGNRSVIHFGQDGGREHDGTLYLLFNTIITPFVAPVVELSAPKASAEFVGNLIVDPSGRQSGQVLVAARGGAQVSHLRILGNGLAGSFAIPGSSIDVVSQRLTTPEGGWFIAPEKHDYRLRPQAAAKATLPKGTELIAYPPAPGEAESTVKLPGYRFKHPADGESRPADSSVLLGAMGK